MWGIEEVAMRENTCLARSRNHSWNLVIRITQSQILDCLEGELLFVAIHLSTGILQEFQDPDENEETQHQ